MTRERGLPDTDLYCITDSGLSRGRSNVEVVRQMLSAGVRIIQYREKALAMRQKYRECLELRPMCAAAGALFIVNDDVGLALAVRADGVHVGQEDLPAEAVRTLVGEKMLVGLSISTHAEADAAARSTVIDYVGAGPVFPTETKKDAGEVGGVKYLDYVLKRINVPVVAIGGIKEGNVGQVVKRGVTRVAIISDIVGAEDIAAKIAGIRKQMRQAGRP